MRNRFLQILSIVLWSVLSIDNCLAKNDQTPEDIRQFCFSTKSYQWLCHKRTTIGPHPIADAVLESKILLINEDSPLANALANAEDEFTKELVRIEQAMRSSPRYLFSFSQRSKIWDYARKFKWLHSLTVIAVPHEIYLGTISRSAFNLRDYELILFDPQQWKLSTIREKRLLVLTELFGLAGMTGEDERYGAAVQILNEIQEKLDNPHHPPNTSQFLEFNPAQAEYELYGVDRKNHLSSFFIPLSSPEKDETNYLLLNPTHPIFDPLHCRKNNVKDNVKTEDGRRDMGVIVKLSNGVPMTVDKSLTEICSSILFARKNMNLRLFYSDSHIVTYCSVGEP